MLSGSTGMMFVHILVKVNCLEARKSASRPSRHLCNGPCKAARMAKAANMNSKLPLMMFCNIALNSMALKAAQKTKGLPAMRPQKTQAEPLVEHMSRTS